jgi:murein DD-endopeptidase MepM/ murein hydrolase activator NlpD
MPERPGLDPQGSEGNPRPSFNPLIAAVPVVVVFLLTALPGNDPVSWAFGDGDGGVRQALVARITEHMTAVPQQEGASPVQVATTTSGGASSSPGGRGATTPATCEPVAGEPYCKYVVQPGDNLASLATRFNLNGGVVPGWELLWASNRADIAGVDDVLAVGQTLRVPTRLGVLHTVFPGESLMALAVAYDVSSQRIADENGLDLNSILVAGEVLIISSPPVIPETPVLPHEANASEEDDEPGSDEPGERTPAPEATADTDDGDRDGDEATPEPEEPGEPEEEEEEPPRRDDPTHMSWPIVQPIRVTNYMSARHPLGMDFGLSHAKGSNITAAADGTVAFAGGDACCSYGYYVIVEHANGLKTLYAHLSKINVRKGQAVNRGDALGVAGSTGYSTGTHLHFEVYLNGKRVNPMNYLPQ